MTIRPFEMLIAEDNEDDIVLIQEAFTDGNLIERIAVVRDGEEALAYLRGEGRYHRTPLPGMVLLDINMPKKSGLEVLREVKADPRLRAIPVVMLTVSERDEDILRSYEQGACSYIRKPVTLSRFISVVREFDLYWSAISKIPTVNR
ncbi:response regulator [Nitrospirales bacterium NOB]|nr:MAG: CheY-like response regulator [Nitrospira sp. OLB3]MBV6470291.1 Response regulator rcp1 [Nitrospirota bacterium]MCE7964321.1 response regulator [Nitrospira sp. NTP2]MCK6493317.1 response regulator [Nitrospira sp.]MDL1888141.1 response regulator [Nitrospirales bacterium NOB]MEB2337327.1 response regulator [Nitrospirales bacterium]